MKKTLQELTIKDPFMFAATMSDAERSREFLTIVLDMEILEVTVVTEKTIVYHPEYHGVRLDVLAVENGSNRHFNVEMQVKDKKNLARRSRYYHSQMDMDVLLTGEDYAKLPDTYVIFICDYDPVGAKLFKYTMYTYCSETSENIADGRKTIWLNTEGENEKDESNALVAFLRYVKNPDTEDRQVESDAFVKALKNQVAAIKRNRDWEAKFMLLKEMMADEREEGRQEGRLEGLAEAVVKLLSLIGNVSESLEQQVMNEQNIEVLEKWLVLAKSSNSIDEFINLMKNPVN